MVDHGAPEPLHAQLTAILRQQIASGELPSHSRLPTLSELADRHKIAITTVQDALKPLKAEGLIVTYPGRGMFVA
jgi:DNA-binding GntR family transcriptional regulator